MPSTAGPTRCARWTLASGAVTSLPYTPQSGEGYGYDLKIISSGKALFTCQFNGSTSSVPFRQVDLATDVISAFPKKSTVEQSAPLARSADRSTLFWMGPNSSFGRWPL